MVLVSEPEMRRFAMDVFAACGMSEQDAEHTANGLITATKRGITTHGVFRLRQYSDSLRAGKINVTPKVELIQKRGCVGLVNADGGYGYRPAALAMQTAVETAKEHGIGLCGVRNSHHFGAAGIYTELAAKAGMIGWATTTTRATIAPFGGSAPVTGNNPISISIPRRAPSRPIVLDMALSQVAMGRLRIAAANGESVPEGWGYDKMGRPTTDPNEVLNDGLLAAIGIHKGSGLSIIVEALAGVLTASPFAKQADNHQFPKGGVGHFLLAIDPGFMRDLDEFYDGVEDLVSQIKGSPCVPGVSEILLPGELEYGKSDTADRDGLTISPELDGQLETLAAELGIKKLSLEMAGASG